jgi:hypothetical protein
MDRFATHFASLDLNTVIESGFRQHIPDAVLGQLLDVIRRSAPVEDHALTPDFDAQLVDPSASAVEDVTFQFFAAFRR